MAFCSILYLREPDSAAVSAAEPACFADLNLHQVVNDITAGRERYGLKPFFYSPLREADAIVYRQRVMADLEDPALLGDIRLFTEKMDTLRGYRALCRRLPWRYNREGWFVQAVKAYCEAVNTLCDGLDRAALRSDGLKAFRCELRSYRASGEFQSLAADTNGVEAALSSVQYSLLIRGGRVRVRRFEQEADFGADMEQLLERFRRGSDPPNHRFRFSFNAGMTHVEARIARLAARLYPDVFSRLDRYCAEHDGFVWQTLARFERELQFYLAYLQYLEPLRRQGLPFCYPDLTLSKQVSCEDGFDLALACKLASQDAPVVYNDFFLRDRERILVVSGPNQGGKTTFARTFGQMHYLASLGCPVPGRRARLFLFDRIFTHFEREEHVKNLRGKLQDDLIRIHAMLGEATCDSIMIINEIFTSTALGDGLFLSRKVMDQLMDRDMLCVYVTFIDELSSLGGKTVSMVSAVEPGNPARRTYKITRRPAAGAVYALCLAEKYRLTYGQIKERVR